MENAFEFKPLLVAAIIGAALMVMIEWQSQSGCSTCPSTSSSALKGAGIGAAVQIGVRIAGVS